MDARDLESRGFDASRDFARLWHAEARKIEEQVSDPEQRWAIMLAALRQIGWPKQQPEPTDAAGEIIRQIDESEQGGRDE